MRFKKLDLNLLVALDTLLKARSVTRTAEQLNLSPSAVSNSLSRLREYFGDELLVQIGRRMEITPLGESLQEPVRDVLNRIESTILIPPEFHPDNTDRTFSIFVSDYTQIVFVPHLMTLTSEQSSTAKFNFLPQIANPHKQLEQGDADLLIIPSGFVSPDHPYDVLYEEDYVCLIWAESSHARSELTFERYAQAKHVVMAPPAGRSDYFEYLAKKKYGINRDIITTTYSFAAVPGLIVGTDHIATVHTRLARLLVKAFPLQIRPLPFHMDSMKQCAQWHHYRSNDQGLVWLREMLKGAVTKMIRSGEPESTLIQ
ncbi:Nodulation protein D I [Marinobacterium lacunae]|uniref:Nodulation protein D I n=1 Tax=Marinobacterium lacunae TaxID=1232683 RepID=A0A081FX21_9GAMM|nr:LysR family transcriptional regulator [Marinobacterium lacunae]KEA63076.1 Nodulation protein D I [Marinobacterium lacunae]